MTKDEAIRQFKRIYPESFIRVLNADKVKDKYIISAYFPDGIFYFVVSENSVSSSYDTESDAKRRI